MPRIPAIILALALAACASTPPVARVAAAVQAEPSDELECMADCLEATDGTCETCARQCLRADEPPILVTMGR